ncbi:MAG: flagellar hook-length control protein FliK [Paenibacillaceae bacterium]|nr:flagellar hook-length control protein FliK [Paenibacillaceae bacterium]
MTTINSLVMTMPGSTAAAQGSATGTAAAGGNAFGQMLVQVIGGTNTQAQTSSLPNLAALLEGLLAGMSSEESAAMLEGPGSEVMVKLLEQLADNPELLEQHLGDEDMQAWLAQAALLLQGMQLLPAAVLNTEDAASSLVEQTGGESASAPAMNAQQAQIVLKQFAQALNQHPDEIFLNQLQDKLAAILTKRNQPELALPVQANDAGTASGNKSAEVTVTVQTTTAASRLEMLAAKTAPIQLTGGSKDTQTLPQEQSESGPQSGESQEGPFSAGTVNGRHALDRAPAPVETFPVRAGQLAEDISKLMLGKLRVQTGNGITEARLSLTPEALGHVDVRLTLHNGQLVAQFAAQTAMGKDALESQLAQLRNMLQTQGIQVEKIEVAQSPSLQSSMFQDPRGQQQSRQSGSRGREQPRDGNEEYAVEAAAILRKEASDEEGFDVIA